jgi:hypothetical protein
MVQQENFDEKESLKLITDMINKTKQSFHDTGISPILWGAVIMICSLVTFFQVIYKFTLPVDVWILTFIAIIPQVIISIKESKNKKVKTYNDIALDVVWICFGISMFILMHSINGFYFGIQNDLGEGLLKNSSFRLYNYTSPFFLMIYGFPTIITGAIMKFKPMLYGGIFCWLMSIITVYTNGKIDLLLIALSVCLAWFIPGIILNARYRKAKAANV